MACIQVDEGIVVPTTEKPESEVPQKQVWTPSKQRDAGKVKVFSFIDASKPAGTLAWSNLSFSLNTPKGRKDILKDVNGDLRPGELTCIFGPSGSGKTSLLNVLAGRVRSGGRSKAQIDGQISVNNKAIIPSSCQQMFGYVMQDDALLGTMTPREVLQFAAHLRLSKGASAQASQAQLIEDLLSSMSLTKCADTMVGNELIKGISGGERKRTAVAAELITNPEITFLDEPTSGLDSGAAFDLMTILKQLCQMQRAVLCTIHQPSSEIVHMCDQTIFLAAGELAYHGPPGGIRSHFDTLNLRCPEDYNPADFVMFCIQAKNEEQVMNIVSAWSTSTTKREAPTMPEPHLPAIPKRKGFFTELYALSVREAKNTWRDKGTLGARFGSTLFFSLIYSLVFFQIGSPNPEDSKLVDRDTYDMQSHAGAVMLLGMGGMFGAAQPMILTFTFERQVFIREYASNMYGPLPYFISKTVVELPIIVLQNLVMWLLSYWMMALQGNFLVFVLGTSLISMAAASTALLASCLARDPKQAMECAPALFVPQMLFAGFFVKMKMIPVWLRWVQYICSLKWGMNILYLNEFADTPLVEVNDIDEDNLWVYYIVLIAIFLGFRVLGAIALACRATGFYN